MFVLGVKATQELAAQSAAENAALEEELAALREELAAVKEWQRRKQVEDDEASASGPTGEKFTVLNGRRLLAALAAFGYLLFGLAGFCVLGVGGRGGV